MVGRHAYATSTAPPNCACPARKVTISCQPEGGRPAQTLDVIDFGEGGGVAMAMHNIRKFIESIARASFSWHFTRVARRVASSCSIATIRIRPGMRLQACSRLAESVAETRANGPKVPPASAGSLGWR